MTKKEINRIKYMICCTMCDKCEAEIWAKNKAESEDKTWQSGKKL